MHQWKKEKKKIERCFSKGLKPYIVQNAFWGGSETVKKKKEAKMLFFLEEERKKRKVYKMNLSLYCA